MDKNTTLTWDDVARIYDKHHPAGRKSRTLMMEMVLRRCLDDGLVVETPDGFYNPTEKGLSR